MSRLEAKRVREKPGESGKRGGGGKDVEREGNPFERGGEEIAKAGEEASYEGHQKGTTSDR